MARTLAQIRQNPRKRKLLLKPAPSSTRRTTTSSSRGVIYAKPLRNGYSRAEQRRRRKSSRHRQQQASLLVNDGCYYDSSDDDDDDEIGDRWISKKSKPWNLEELSQPPAAAAVTNSTPEVDGSTVLVGGISSALPAMCYPTAASRYKESSNSDDGRCQAKNRVGLACGGIAVKGGILCRYHKAMEHAAEDNTEMSRSEARSNKNPRRCQAKNQRGGRCAAFAMGEGRYCNRHLNTVPIQEDPIVKRQVVANNRLQQAEDSSDHPRKCQGTNQMGEPCAAFAMGGSQYCNRHQSYRYYSKPAANYNTSVASDDNDATTTNISLIPDGKCHGKNQRGEPCAAHAVVGGLYCPRHKVTQCWAICVRGCRCTKVTKNGSKFCMYHKEEQPLGVINESEAIESVTSHKGVSNKIKKESAVFSFSEDQDGIKSPCHALCRSGYRCSKLKEPGEPFCNFHLENRFGDVRSSDDEDDKNDEKATIGDDDPYVNRCFAIASRDGGKKRCGKKLAPGGGKFCCFHLRTRVGTVEDYGMEEKDDTFLPRCRGITSRRGKRCAKEVVPGSDYCMYHSKSTDSDGEFEEEEEDEMEEEEDGSSDIVRFQRCHAVARRSGVRCGKQIAPGSAKFCHYHLKASKRIGTIDDEELEEDDDEEEYDEYEESEAEADDFRGPTDKDTRFRGVPGTTQCTALSTRMRGCSYCALPGKHFCNLHLTKPPLHTTASGLETTEGLSNYLQFFRGLPGTSKCAAISQKGKPCSYIADDDSVHCARHRGSSRAGNKSQPPAEEGAEENEQKRNGRRLDRDKVFNQREGERRCMAKTRGGVLCVNCAVLDTLYCLRHLESDDFLPDPPADDMTAVSIKQNISQNDAVSLESGEGTAKYAKVAEDKGEADNDEKDDDDEGPFTYNEFLNMWGHCEEFAGQDTDDIESTRRVRGANHKMCPEDTDGQAKAQYGRLLPGALKTLLKDVLCLTKDDVFLDIGHGIGNACLQAAFTFGCEARGIEVVRGRNAIAEVFRDQMVSAAKENLGRTEVGEVHLRHGRLEEEANRDFLTKGVTRVYVNNFDGNFAEKSSKSNQTYVLDDYIAGLFGLMAPGTIMVTLHPLTLPPTRNEANEIRVKLGLKQSECASFYDTDKILLGKACDTVKWRQRSGNQKGVHLYKYERLEQPSKEAAFLCGNPTCEAAKNEVPIPATMINEEGRVVLNHCSCKVSTKSLRRQGRKLYA